MRRTLFIVMLAAIAALAQNAGQQPSAKTVKTSVSPATPVISIYGLCPGRPLSKQTLREGTCTTALSRRQFEGLVDTMKATMPGLGPTYFRSVAEGYAYLLINADAGEKAGVDKDPRFAQVMEVTRLRTLGDLYRTEKDLAARHVSPEEINAYYQKNVASFEEVLLHRLIVPRNNPANLNDTDYRAKATKLARETRERAANGEDINQLQKDALRALGKQGELPNAVQVGVRRGELESKAEKAVFALKPGEVTAVTETPALYVIYKRDSRRMLRLDEVKDEIAQTLYLDRTDAAKKALWDHVHAEYNERYFANWPASSAKGETVITIHGLCPADQPGAACVTKVSSQEFEIILKVIRATTSNPVAALPRNVAEGYVDLLVYGYAARKAGLEKDPRFANVMRLAHTRALADMYRLKRDEDAHDVAGDQVKGYYQAHPANFEELMVRHISVPRQNAGKPDAGSSARTKRLAIELQRRAADGESMDKLQQEAHQSLGIKDVPPTLMRPLRRGSLEEKTEKEIFALRPGQVTSVIELPTAYVIYKLESRRMIALPEAKAEIAETLCRQKLDKLTKALFESVHADYNEAYFGAVTSSRWVSAGAWASASPQPTSAK